MLLVTYQSQSGNKKTSFDPVGVKRCFLYDDISQKNLLFYAFGYALQYIVKYLRSVCLADEVALKL